MRVHIVQKGDTLWKIAKQYSIGFEELKRLNAHLANPDYIVPGMEIYLPDGHHVKEKPKEQIKERVESPRQNMPLPTPAPPKIEQPMMPPIQWQPQQPVWPELLLYMPWHIDLTQMQSMPPQLQQPMMPMPEMQQPIMPPPQAQPPMMPMPEVQQPMMPPQQMHPQMHPQMMPQQMPFPPMCMPPMPMMCCCPMPTPYDMMMYPQMQSFPNMPQQQLAAEMEQQASPMMEQEMRNENFYEQMNQPCPCTQQPQMMPLPCQPMPCPPWHY